MNINNIYIPNNKKVVKKKHYLIDNILYAQKLDNIDNIIGYGKRRYIL